MMVWRMLDATPTKANVMPRVHAHRRPEKRPIPAARYRIASITITARNGVGEKCAEPAYPKHRIIQNPTRPRAIGPIRVPGDSQRYSWEQKQCSSWERHNTEVTYYRRATWGWLCDHW